MSFESVGVVNVEFETVFDTDLLLAAPTNKLHGPVALYQGFNLSSASVPDSRLHEEVKHVSRLAISRPIILWLYRCHD